DEDGLARAIGQLSAVVIHIPARQRKAFLEDEPDTEYDYQEYDEMMHILKVYELKSHDHLMTAERETKNLDDAVEIVSHLNGGYQVISELRLGLRSFDSRDHLTVKKPEVTAAGETTGANVKLQREVEVEDLIQFIFRRQWRDDDSAVDSLPDGHELLHAHAGHLDNATLQSGFTWSNPRGLVKMRVDIVCHHEDRVEAMLHWYGPLIARFEVEGLSLTDATAMGKLAQRKKRPLSPKYFSIKNVHLIEPAVREILQDVVVTGAMEDVVVLGALALELKGVKSDANLMESRFLPATFLQVADVATRGSAVLKRIFVVDMMDNENNATAALEAKVGPQSGSKSNLGQILCLLCN
ncbi:hypothetical protein BGZ95_011054, partial [Linnemannia exigua]